MGLHNSDNAQVPFPGVSVRQFSNPDDFFKLLHDVLTLPKPGTGPVSLNRSDIEIIADAMVFYHSAMEAITKQGFALDNDTAHAQYHETGTKIADILQRMAEGDPTLTLEVTPF